MFSHDPAVRYLLPDPGRCERAVRFTFSCYLRYGERFGVVDRSPFGAAVRLPEHHTYLSVINLLRSVS